LTPATYEEACALLADRDRTIAELRRRLDWADERPGGGPRKISGFTDTETRVLRKIAARGYIGYGMFEALQRHMSNIRKKLPAEVRVTTNIGEGYEVTAGLALLRQLVAGEISLVIEAVTDAIETRVLAKPQHPRAKARQQARKDRRKRRSIPKPKVTVVMGMSA
jgi:hypothetical protein